jgi:pimeloyl-ACP methyl ester carboxylesterase
VVVDGQQQGVPPAGLGVALSGLLQRRIRAMSVHDPNPIWGAPPGWAFDRWGNRGRPVLFINDATVDPSTWWPLAAQLADECRAVVVQPPAQDMPGCVDGLETFDAQLAYVVAQAASQAPVVVGYSSAALLALLVSLFGARHAARAVVNVEQPLDRNLEPCTTRSQTTSLTATGRPLHRCLGTAGCVTTSPEDGTRATWIAALRSLRAPYLSVFGTLPWRGYPDWLRSHVPTSTVLVYGTTGHVPHLADPARFVADIRRVAG